MNRSILYFTAVFALACISSGCGEDNLPPAEAVTVEVAIRPSIGYAYENIPSTYASDGGGLQNVDNAEYCLRYILEVWTQAAEPALAGRWTATSDIGGDAPGFSPRLIQARYTFVVWADFILRASVTEETPEGSDLFYATTGGLRTITLRGDYTINDDAKDAYAGRQSVNLPDGGGEIGIVLQRPLAKIRLLAEDAPGTGGLDGYSAVLAYGAGMYDCFDALTGLASGSAALGTTRAYPCDPGGNTVAFDYLLANDSGLVVDVILAIEYENETTVNKTIPKVPIRKNRLTTVTGGLLTGSGQ